MLASHQGVLRKHFMMILIRMFLATLLEEGCIFQPYLRKKNPLNILRYKPDLHFPFSILFLDINN